MLSLKLLQTRRISPFAFNSQLRDIVQAGTIAGVLGGRSRRKFLDVVRADAVYIFLPTKRQDSKFMIFSITKFS